MTTTKTPQQIANLREALEVWWPSVPEANVADRLRFYTKDESDRTDCCTVACFGGWAARWPGLIAQGLGVSECGYPVLGAEVFGPFIADALFGDISLFKARGSHEADEDFTGTDHELVTNRLRWALEH